MPPDDVFEKIVNTCENVNTLLKLVQKESNEKTYSEIEKICLKTVEEDKVKAQEMIKDLEGNFEICAKRLHSVDEELKTYKNDKTVD